MKWQSSFWVLEGVPQKSFFLYFFLLGSFCMVKVCCIKVNRHMLVHKAKEETIWGEIFWKIVICKGRIWKRQKKIKRAENSLSSFWCKILYFGEHQFFLTCSKKLVMFLVFWFSWNLYKKWIFREDGEVIKMTICTSKLAFSVLKCKVSVILHPIVLWVNC